MSQKHAWILVSCHRINTDILSPLIQYPRSRDVLFNTGTVRKNSTINIACIIVVKSNYLFCYVTIYNGLQYTGYCTVLKYLKCYIWISVLLISHINQVPMYWFRDNVSFHTHMNSGYCFLIQYFEYSLQDTIFILILVLNTVFQSSIQYFVEVYCQY